MLRGRIRGGVLRARTNGGDRAVCCAGDARLRGLERGGGFPRSIPLPHPTPISSSIGDCGGNAAFSGSFLPAFRFRRTGTTRPLISRTGSPYRYFRAKGPSAIGIPISRSSPAFRCFPQHAGQHSIPPSSRRTLPAIARRPPAEVLRFRFLFHLLAFRFYRQTAAPVEGAPTVLLKVFQQGG
jgi:hypothetical protein